MSRPRPHGTTGQGVIPAMNAPRKFEEDLIQEDPMVESILEEMKRTLPPDKKFKPADLAGDQLISMDFVTDDCTCTPVFSAPRKDDLFQDFGLPDEETFGILPFEESVCPPPGVRSDIPPDKFDEDSDLWFSKPSNPDPPDDPDDPDEPGDPDPPTDPPVTTDPEFTRTAEPTPSQIIATNTAYSQSFASIDSQDPDGINWQTNWPPWNGVPFNPIGKTKEQICAFITAGTGSMYVTRGLRTLFYSINPFQDNTNPTYDELVIWHTHVINHFRDLFGQTIKVTPSARLMLEARWADERKFTQAWDTDYPDSFTCGDQNNISCLGQHKGPCWNNGLPVDYATGHCGESHFPNAVHRAPYIAGAPYNNNFTKYPELQNYTLRHSLATGINLVNGNIPWSIKLAAHITQFICTEGLSDHAGPFVGVNEEDGILGNPHTEFGISWWPLPNHPLGNSMQMRGKWR